MKDQRWVAIDVETATNYRRSICSLGVATVAPDGSLVEREWLVKPPGNRYDAENTALHGLDADATERAPTFPEVWTEASEIIADAYVIAHYAEFDTDCIRAAMRHYHQTEPVFSPLGCTLRMAHLVLPQRTTSYSLASLCADHQIPHTPHNAASDAAAVMTLAGVLVAQWGQGDLRQLRAASNRGHQARADAAQKRQWYHSTAPPSERQINFLRTLLQERHIKPETVLRHISTSGQMSRLIDEILEGPRGEDVSSSSERKRYKSRLERTLRQIVENPPRAAPAPKPTRTMSPAETAARRDANRERREQERQSTENFRQQSRSEPPSVQQLLNLHQPGPRATARNPKLKASRVFSDLLLARVQNSAQAEAMIDYMMQTKSENPARWETQLENVLQQYSTPAGLELPKVGEGAPIPDYHNNPEPFEDKIERLRGERPQPPTEYEQSWLNSVATPPPPARQPGAPKRGFFRRLLRGG